MKDGLPFHSTKLDFLKSILPNYGDEAPPDSVEDQEDDSFDIYRFVTKGRKFHDSSSLAS